MNNLLSFLGNLEPRYKERLLAARRASSSLLKFTIATHPNYTPNWHHKVVASYLEKVVSGEIRRLIVALPPRFGKSELSSIRLPAYFLGKNPTKRVILGSYGDTFSADFGRKIRNLIVSPLYHSCIFPGVALSRDSTSADRWDLRQGGGFVGVGRGGAIVGKGAHLLVLDDLLKNVQEAYSPHMRDLIWDWYLSTAYTRLEERGAIVLLMTRWHKDDVIGRILKHEAHKWTFLKMPAVAQKDEDWGVYQRRAGEGLWGAKYPQDVLLEIKAKIGMKFWTSLYQQEPTEESGNKIKRAWWKRLGELPKECARKVHSWDTGFKDGQNNDWTACTKWMETSIGYGIYERYREKLQFPDLVRAVKDHYRRDYPSAVLIEDKASGQPLVQTLRRETSIPVMTFENALRQLKIPTNISKDARGDYVSPQFESGNVWILDGQAWTEGVIAECAEFPNGESDDTYDTVTQALIYFARPELVLV